MNILSYIESDMNLGYALYISLPLSIFYAAGIFSACKFNGYKFNFLKFLIFRVAWLLIGFIFFEFIVFDVAGVFLLFFSLEIKPIGAIFAKLCGVKREELNSIIDRNNSSIFLNCKKCNRLISLYDRVCPGCGEHTDNYNAFGICKNCNSPVLFGEKICSNCGSELISSSNYIPMNPLPNFVNNDSVVPSNIVYAKYTDYDPIFKNSEKALLDLFVAKEMKKLNFDSMKGQVPKKIYKRRMVFSVLFVLLLLFFTILLFFHLDFLFYLLFFAFLTVIFIFGRKYNLKKYFIKEIKSRPNEKISNILISTKNDFVPDRSIKALLIGVVLAISIPLIYFREPRIFYEKSSDKNGYVIRFYTLGLFGNEKIDIPNSYNGKPIVGIRGDAFKNLPVKEVYLPDSITEIRGSAFKNDSNLIKINIPKNLEYLGGGAFAYCTSLESIELPDTLTYLGGEAFYNDTSLKYVKLSENLTEIRGDTFYNCNNLVSIKIPDKVNRIGGHAFQYCSNLSEVFVSGNSKLYGIGSSAFRNCNNLRNIILPSFTSVNSKAFKESPTVIERYQQNNEMDDYNTVENNVDTSLEKEKVLPKTTINDTRVATITYKETVIFKDDKENDMILHLDNDMIISYENLSNNLATLSLKYNDEVREITYDVDKKIPLHYIHDNYEVYIRCNDKNDLSVIIYPKAPLPDDYLSYINLSLESNSTIEIRSDNISSVFITVGELKSPVNDEYSFDVLFQGDINDNVTFTNKNKAYVKDKLKMRVVSYWEYTHSAVIYLK